jgi:SSS family solute:Na+ symporter
VIGAAGVLTALVPGSMILTSASTLLANDVYRGALQRNASDATIGKLARLLVPVVALVAVGFTLHGGDTIVALLLMGYSLVTQLFPALLCSLATRNRATKQGAFCGILAGVFVVALTTSLHLSVAQLFPFLSDSLKDVNIGFLALAVNVIVFAIVSAVTQPHASTEPSHARQH